MGFRDRRHHQDGPVVQRYQMREKLLSIGDDYWIENESGERAYKVDGKALRLRDTFELRDASGAEVAKIQERKLRMRDTMKIERAAGNATVHKALVGIRDRFTIDVDGGPDLKAHGNIVDHEYEIERDGDVVAEVSKKWFRVRDTYGVEIQPGQDAALDPGDHRLHRRHGPGLTTPPSGRPQRSVDRLKPNAARRAPMGVHQRTFPADSDPRMAAGPPCCLARQKLRFSDRLATHQALPPRPSPASRLIVCALLWSRQSPPQPQC